jgi:glycosyltransferase involved in cell wall biosynthesis
MKKLNLHLPINSTSLGQVSTSLLKNLFDREKELNLDICLQVIGGVDLSSQAQNQEFNNWLQLKINRGQEVWDRKVECFKLWHLQSSLESFSNNQSLLTFQELDGLTKFETCIARNNKIALSSKYSQDVFKIYGIDSHYLPLFFDSVNFKREDKRFHGDDRITFCMVGKLEARKHHKKVIQAWIKKYGGDRRYVLQLGVTNPFLVQQGPQGQQIDHNPRLLNEIFNGEKPFNVVAFPWFRENSTLNQLYNSCNIVLDCSGAESWSLPSFTMTALGKHNVILNATGMKEWANPQNSTLINPDGKEDAVDGIFFNKGAPFNQGKWFTFNEEEFLNACDVAIERVKKDPINHEGLKLQEQFSIEKFTDNVLKITLNS